MPPSLSTCLADVLRLSEEMIQVAAAGNEVAHDVDSGVLFGTLRDCGYKLKQMADAEIRRATDRREPRQDQVPRTVLIVDDEPDTLTYLGTWFQDHGFTASVAHDGEEAMKMAAVSRPDLITLDMNMPERSGVKVLHQLKNDAAMRGVPVIVITGIGEPLNQFLKRLGKAPKPDGFLSKPVDLRELAELVGKLVA